ncbi:MAG: hypothetical protein ISN28_12650 [Ectothiorhodospiraceae bacterium AqS1]|nr:hypothetical protein [Ectothiorhodospiraceae bacterium AqS1]
MVFPDDHLATSPTDTSTACPICKEIAKPGSKEFVRKRVHKTGIESGIESAWAALERSFEGIDHHWSVRHCRRYIDELTLLPSKGSGRVGALEFLGAMCKGAVGKRLTYASLMRCPATSRRHDFEEGHLRCDRSGRERIGIVSRDAAAIATGFGNTENGFGMMPLSGNYRMGTFPDKSLSFLGGRHHYHGPG